MPPWGRRAIIKPRVQITPEMDWREELVEILILAGTTGLTQSAIVKRFDNWVQADDLNTELAGLEALGKVQKFLIKKPKGRPATIWRATTLIRKSDHDLL